MVIVLHRNRWNCNGHCTLWLVRRQCSRTGSLIWAGDSPFWGLICKTKRSDVEALFVCEFSNFYEICFCLGDTVPEWLYPQGRHRNSAKCQGVWGLRTKSIIPEHSRRIEKFHQKGASNLACNREEEEMGSTHQLWGRACNQGCISWMKCLPGVGPINIKWHPIDFSKWVPFLTC